MDTVCECADCSQHLALFGLKRPVTMHGVDVSYRDFVKVWHPDRFEDQPNLRQKAEEHFKQVQIAYRELRDHASRPSTSASTNRRSSPENFEVLFQSPGFSALIDGKRFFASSSDFPAQIQLAMNDYEYDPLIFFIDLSLLKTAGAYLAFTQQRILCKELFSPVEMDYDEFAQADISIGNQDSPKADFTSRLAAKIAGDTQQLRLSISTTSNRTMTVGPPLYDRKLRDLHKCLAALQSYLRP